MITDYLIPATTIFSPVMYAASEEARKLTIPPMSSGTPNLDESKLLVEKVEHSKYVQANQNMIKVPKFLGKRMRKLLIKW